MLRWLKRKITWAVAGRELAELERWRVECNQMRRWLAEFPDVCDALDHLSRTARGYENPEFITVLRDYMRCRRDAKPLTVPPINRTPETVDEFTRAWRAAYGVVPRFSLTTTSLADLRSASALDAVDQHMADHLRTIENSLFADPPAPTHYMGIFPVPDKS
jgi:hypothetical protein